MKLGMIGLGRMGRAMAQRLTSTGAELVVWNRTEEKALDLSATIADSPAGLLHDVPIVVLSLFDSRAVEQVLLGESGLLTGDCEGKIIIDTTTNSVESAERFAKLVGARGAFYLEAPVMGSVGPAAEGTLKIVVSGPRDAFDEARDVLDLLGDRIFYLGAPTLATRMKLVNNLVLGALVAALCEALTVGTRAGLPREQVLAILEEAAGRSAVLAAKKGTLLAQDYTPRFSAASMHKDLHYLEQLAFAVGVPVPTAAAVKELYGIAVATGLGEEDLTVVGRLLGEVPVARER
jgi:3-hydroxyisobutyrate dehydrogenase